MPTDLRPALVLPTTDVVAIARVPSPLLPRPAPLAVIGNAATRNEGGSKSPLKRRALRAWEVPAETERASRVRSRPSFVLNFADDPSQAESENAPPRQTPGSTSASTALQRSVSTPALSSTVVVTLTRPTPPTTIVSPLKLKPLPTHAATPEAANDEQPSALTAPAEKLDAEAGVELFGAVVEPAPAMLPRPKRTRTPTVDVEADAGPSARSTRRTALNAQLASTTPLPRPTRRQPAPVVEEEPPPEEPEAPIERAPITFNPAPALTQEELSQLTQKNTKRNKMLFNKLDLQTIHMDTNRPPSPTSKIRRSLGSEGAAGRPTTKEGREARAAKRRTALRSSTDGTEVLLVDLELEEEGAKDGAAVLPLVHYRAPGDEEEYMSPVRPRKSKGKKRSLATSEGERRRVKWDRALVYEGPLEPQNEGEPDGILKVRSFRRCSWRGVLILSHLRSAENPSRRVRQLDFDVDWVRKARLRGDSDASLQGRRVGKRVGVKVYFPVSICNAAGVRLDMVNECWVLVLHGVDDRVDDTDLVGEVELLVGELRREKRQLRSRASKIAILTPNGVLREREGSSEIAPLPPR